MIQDFLVSCYGSSDTISKCVVEGVVVCNETLPKRIVLFARNDKDLKILSITQSLVDKTWTLYCGGETPDTEMIVTGIDDSGVYHPDSVDRVSIADKTFVYSTSHLKNVEGVTTLLQEVILGLDRSISKSFINWVYDCNQQDLNNNMILTNYIDLHNFNLTGIKSFIFEIETSWGGSYTAARRIEFYDDTDTLIPLNPATDYIAYATSQLSANYTPAMTFNTALSKIGAWINTQWLGTALKQRLIIVFTTTKNISKIVFNGTHSDGTNTDSSFRHTYIYASTTAGGYTNTTWEAAITDCIPIAVTEFPKHISANVIDDYTYDSLQDFSTNLMTGVKSVVIDMFDNWGNVTYMGLRRVEFFDINGQRIPILATDITAYYTSQLNTSYAASMAFITAASKIGGWGNVSWLSANGILRRQRIICVFNTTKDIKYMMITNGHNGGDTYNTIGTKNTKIYFSTATLTANDAVCNLPVPSSTLIYDGIIPIHKEANDYDYFVIKPSPPVKVTDLSNNILSPATINLENNYVINTKDNNSYSVSGISGNTFNTTPKMLTQYSTLIKNIVAYKSIDEKLRYTGTILPSAVTTSVAVPLSKYGTLSSIQTSEIKKVIGFIEPVPDYGELCIQGGDTNGSIIFTDKSKSNYPITVYSTTHSSTQYKFSPTSIDFTVSGCYLRIVNDDTFNLKTRDFTFSFWIWKSSYAGNNYFFDTATDGCVLRCNAGNILLNAPTISTTVLTTPAPSINTWHLITLTRTSGVFKLYIDRVLVATSTSTYNATLFGVSGGNFTIGNYGGGGPYHLTGYMEEFRFLMRSLSQEEITALPDARQADYVEVQEVGDTAASVFYSISFDDKTTYKIWSGTVWREIASNLPSVHGNVGDNDWYFRDNASVWSKTGVTDSKTAISKAVAYTNNQMQATQLNALTSTEFTATNGFVSADGFVNLGIGFISTTNGVGAVVSSIDINGSTNNVWAIRKIIVNIPTNITSSQISWNYKETSGYDFESMVSIETLLTGQTSWNLCSNGGSIVGLTSGTAENKELYVRVTAPKLSNSATFDPALFVLNVTVR